MVGFRTNEISPRPNQLQFKSPNQTVNLSCAAPFASFFCQPEALIRITGFPELIQPNRTGRRYCHAFPIKNPPENLGESHFEYVRFAPFGYPYGMLRGAT